MIGRLDDLKPMLLRTKNVHHARNVLAAYRTFRQLFAAYCTGHHVATFQQDTIDGRVHADFA